MDCAPTLFILFLARERLARCRNSWNDDWGGAYGACCYIIKSRESRKGRGCDYIAQSHPSKSTGARASSFFFEWIEKRDSLYNMKKKSAMRSSLSSCSSFFPPHTHRRRPSLVQTRTLPKLSRTDIIFFVCVLMFPFLERALKFPWL